MAINGIENQRLEHFRYPLALRALEIALLGIVTTVFAYWFVPTHRTTIWFNPEITAWVAPLSNRMSEGWKLYADGMHIPMPPLPFVLLQMLPGDYASYLAESSFNFGAQAFSFLLLYLALIRYVPGPAPFLATLASFPLYFLMTKSIFYDALVQLTITGMAISAASIVLPRPAGPPAAENADVRTGPPLGWLLILSVVSIAALLSKHSNAAGAIPGAVALLLFFPQRLPIRGRLVNAGLYFVFSIISLLLFCVAMSPVVDIRGMIVDVYLTGSEPKEGTGALIPKMGRYLGTVASMVAGVTAAGFLLRLSLNRWRETKQVVTTLTAALILLLLGFYFWDSAAFFANQPWLKVVKALAWLLLGGGILNASMSEGEPTEEPPATPLSRPSSTWGPILAGVMGMFLGLLGMIAFSPRIFLYPGPEGSVGQHNITTDPVLGALLGAAVAILLHMMWLGKRAYGRYPLPLLALSAYLLVLAPAAIFQNLSGFDFYRWTKHANPLITSLLVFGAWLAIAPLARFSSRPRRLYVAFALASVLLFQSASWVQLNDAYSRLKNINARWEGICFLEGALMPDTGDGMYKLVLLVRQLAPNPARDSVLLLPNDPNVEAWFERRRPELTSAIVFTDQYWDRYVEEDFERIAKDPPKVILIGPYIHWEVYSEMWHPGWGAVRLINRVREEIISEHYTLYSLHPITFREDVSYMEVFVRNDDHEAENRKEAVIRGPEESSAP